MQNDNDQNFLLTIINNVYLTGFGMNILYIICKKFQSNEFVQIKVKMKNISNVLFRKQRDIFFRLVENCYILINFEAESDDAIFDWWTTYFRRWIAPRVV